MEKSLMVLFQLLFENNSKLKHRLVTRNESVLQRKKELKKAFWRFYGMDSNPENTVQCKIQTGKLS